MESGTRNKLLRARKFLLPLAVLCFWIIVWAILALVINKEVFLPSPVSVGRVLLSLITLPQYWLSIGTSLAHVLIGFLLGCAFGLLLAVLCFKSVIANALFSPVLSVIRAVPVASFIILALFLIGTEKVPSFTAFLMVAPIVFGNTLSGLRAADKDLHEVCTLYRFGMWKTVRLLYLPALRPYFFAAARTSIGMAWKAGIAAEVLCTSLSNTIGGQIYNAKNYLEISEVFAWTITVICISMLIENLLFRLPVFRKEEFSKEVRA